MVVVGCVALMDDIANIILWALFYQLLLLKRDVEITPTSQSDTGSNCYVAFLNAIIENMQCV
jgi:hypothetical protein